MKIRIKGDGLQWRDPETGSLVRLNDGDVFPQEFQTIEEISPALAPFEVIEEKAPKAAKAPKGGKAEKDGGEGE